MPQSDARFRRYRRTQIGELRPWQPDDDMAGVSVSRAEAEAGSPKLGDMIARNPANHADQWLVSADYFAANFAPLDVAGDWQEIDRRPLIFYLEKDFLEEFKLNDQLVVSVEVVTSILADAQSRDLEEPEL